MELSKLAWPDARQAIRRSKVALLPVGATEQHGPHLPIGTDWFIASRIAGTVSQAGDFLLLPGLPIGVSSEHRQFWGSLSVSPDLVFRYVVACCRSIATHGLSRIVLINGHGSNAAPLQRACRELREEKIFAFVFNWWESIASTLAELFPNPTAHAGSIETSLMLAIDPDLVHSGRFDEADIARHWGTYVEGVLVGFDAVDFTEQGNVGDPKLADAGKGKTILASACERLTRFCRWFADRSEEDLVSRHHLE